MATKEQIWTAADELTAEGRNPPLAAVRERLGGGSYTDISGAMQAWRTNRQASTTPIREPAPAAITERLEVMAADLWAVTLELANGRLQAEREALEKAREEAEQTRQEAADLADQLAVELDEARTKVDLQNVQLTANGGEIERFRSQLHSQNEATTIAKHRAELAEARGTELYERAAQLAALLEREQDARTKTETAAKANSEENVKLQARLDASERRNLEIDARIDAAEARARQATENAAELRGRLAGIERPPKKDKLLIEENHITSNVEKKEVKNAQL